jgi:hypothetical protein
MGVPTKWEIARIFVVGTDGSGFCAEAAPEGVIGLPMGISRRVAPLGTVPVGTIKAFADIVPWGTNVKGEKGENGFEPIGTDDRDLVAQRSRLTAD